LWTNFKSKLFEADDGYIKELKW
jgi:hypothetical protein